MTLWRALAERVRKSLAYVRHNPDYGAWVFVVCVFTIGLFALCALWCMSIALIQKMIPGLK